ILRKYSDHITLPILMKQEKWDAEAKKQIQTDEDEQINQASALWARPKSEISEEQYHEFPRHVAHVFEPPLAYTHARVEGRQEFTQLFFIPQRAPFDLWDRDHRRGIKLYVPRVFLMDAGQHRPAAECLTRNPAAVQGRADHPCRLGEARARPDRGAGRETAREVRHL